MDQDDYYTDDTVYYEEAEETLEGLEEEIEEFLKTLHVQKEGTVANADPDGPLVRSQNTHASN